MVLDQPDFLNACLRIETELDPEELLDACKEVERVVGRQAGGPRHGPRVIDVDLLLLDGVRYRSPRLTLPHPEVSSPAFCARAAAGARSRAGAAVRRAGWPTRSWP